MAVYKKTYRPYEGALTARWSRLLVIPRYAFEDLQRRRFLSIFFFCSFLYPLVCAIIIYIQHNASALSLIGAQSAQNLISINVTFFLSLLGWQSMMALFLAAFVGPGQVSPDLANNALALYLARPFSRTEYVLGKMGVLLILMSLMTWVPGLLLFVLQGYLEGWSWMANNARLAMGIFFGSLVWIVLLSLLALALSAWVKWKPAAGALMFVVFFVTSAFAATVNQVQRTHWGNVASLSYLVGSVWEQFFEGSNKTTNGAVFFRSPMGEEIPMWCCWSVLALVMAICVWMLTRKIRGTEVVR